VLFAKITADATADVVGGGVVVCAKVVVCNVEKAADVTMFAKLKFCKEISRACFTAGF